MNNLPSKEEPKELSAREIFNRIVKGQVVRIPNDPVLAKQLHNHLNVIKSREKRIFADLGLDFISSVVSVEAIQAPPKFVFDPKNPTHRQQIYEVVPTILHFDIKLIAPKKRKKYTAFVIANEQPNPV